MVSFATVFPLTGQVNNTCPSFSRSIFFNPEIAVSIPDSGLVHVYEITDLAAPNKWQLLHTIKEVK
jgi:hypothetical protein